MQRTFPVAPLVDFIEHRGPFTAVLDPWPNLQRTLARAKARSGRIMESTADKAACTLGVHPADIWPDWWSE